MTTLLFKNSSTVFISDTSMRRCFVKGPGQKAICLLAQPMDVQIKEAKK